MVRLGSAIAYWGSSRSPEKSYYEDTQKAAPGNLSVRELPKRAFLGFLLREIFACNPYRRHKSRSADPCFTQQTAGLTRGYRC